MNKDTGISFYTPSTTFFVCWSAFQLQDGMLVQDVKSMVFYSFLNKRWWI